jgi:hypothetical protein
VDLAAEYPVTVEATDYITDYPNIWATSVAVERNFVLIPKDEYGNTPAWVSDYDPVYCFESLTNAKHFYTLGKYDCTEEPRLSEPNGFHSDPDKWKYEGIAFCVWDSNTPDPNRLKAVCRFARVGDPMQVAYAFTKAELDSETNHQYQWTCKDEEAFFVYPADTDLIDMPIEAIAIYRKWHGYTQGYSYTIDGNDSTSTHVWYACDPALVDSAGGP